MSGTLFCSESWYCLGTKSRVAVMAGLDAPGTGADPERLGEALAAAIETPLGPLVEGARLRDLDSSARLDELDFELPLAGGETPSGRVRLAAIADVLTGSGDARLEAYAGHLADPRLRESVRGYLAGGIDLVGRIDGDPPRFFVVDYKTNWLAPPGEELTAWHYRPEALTREMARHHYLLQGTLYSTAVHRYLRWRLPGYDPAVNFAGVLYLFLRGMSGPRTPAVDGGPCGVDLVTRYESELAPRNFCSNCGSSLYDDLGEVYFVAAGLMRDLGLEPSCHQQVAYKASWHQIGDEAPQFDEMPPG